MFSLSHRAAASVVQVVCRKPRCKFSHLFTRPPVGGPGPSPAGSCGWPGLRPGEQPPTPSPTLALIVYVCLKRKHRGRSFSASAPPLTSTFPRQTPLLVVDVPARRGSVGVFPGVAPGTAPGHQCWLGCFPPDRFRTCCASQVCHGGWAVMEGGISAGPAPSPRSVSGNYSLHLPASASSPGRWA